LTGHLILSTVHAPTAAGVFARLVDLGREPFLVASAVSAILSQRLARKVCDECRKPAQPTPMERERLALEDLDGDWARGAGCSACGGTGYRGRTGLFELLEVNDAIREGIMAGRPSGELERAAGPRTSLRADAIGKARAGLISLDEVVRVLGQG
jgi:type II secretory ATPase GspE/PulE/Tfp pilus assembly ATPase PilB-like protein